MKLPSENSSNSQQSEGQGSHNYSTHLLNKVA
uniref:Uncharacterized protein n=1 Tax=Rhizophora mucronata TaxID=61149 RepID=A0A2P2IJD7_RHIMU